MYVVPWGYDWPQAERTFRIVDVYDHGYYIRSEAYVIHHTDGTHNPPGHFSGSREYVTRELRRMIAAVYICESCPHKSCQSSREFLATGYGSEIRLV